MQKQASLDLVRQFKIHYNNKDTVILQLFSQDAQFSFIQSQATQESTHSVVDALGLMDSNNVNNIDFIEDSLQIEA